MPSFKFIPRVSGIREVATGPKVRDHVATQARRVAAQSRSIAPTMGIPEYRGSIKSGPADVQHMKVTADVGSDDPFWHLVEFGSINNAAHHPLERGVTGAGFEFKAGR